MNDHAGERRVSPVSRTLAQLKAHVDERRAELAQLRRTLAEVPRNLNGPGDELVEANEQLVLAALHAEAIAETAVSNLDELARASQRDALTDTPNRALMLDRMVNAIALARRHSSRIAVLFIDLDRFKQINDSLGHAVGDEVLQRVARRLEDVVRDSDTVSRHGGDEFLVLLTEVSQPSDARLIAEKMIWTLAAPYSVGNHELSLSPSIGIAIFPEDGEHATTLISQADAAMYRAKRRGGGDFEFCGAAIPINRDQKSSTADKPHPPGIHNVLRRSPDPHIQDLCEANERLVLAAISAQEMEARVEEAYRQQIRFLTKLAHELRNPLTAIQAASDLLAQAQHDDPLHAQLHASIEEQAIHMSMLVDDLLESSCSDMGKLVPECDAVEITGILELAIETCRPVMEARHQHLQVRLPISPLSVQGDPACLTQIFTRLLDNASKNTPEGGEVTLAAGMHNHAMAITVSDNGFGIATESMPATFDLPAEDIRAPASPEDGPDIRLAAIRDLVEAQGGTLVAKRAGSNLGSEFVVELPLVDKPTAA